MGVERIWTEDEIHKWVTAHYNPILRESNPVIRQWTTAMVRFDAFCIAEKTVRLHQNIPKPENSSESLDGLALNHEIDVRIFHEIKHPAIGVSLFMEPTLYRTWFPATLVGEQAVNLSVARSWLPESRQRMRLKPQKVPGKLRNYGSFHRHGRVYWENPSFSMDDNWG